MADEENRRITIEDIKEAAEILKEAASKPAPDRPLFYANTQKVIDYVRENNLFPGVELIVIPDHIELVAEEE